MTMTSELENLDAPGRIFNINHMGWCDFTWLEDRDEKDMPRIVYLDDKLSEDEILALLTPSEQAQYAQWKIVHELANENTIHYGNNSERDGWTLLSSVSHGVWIFIDICFRLDDQQFWDDLELLAQEFGGYVEPYDEQRDEVSLGMWMAEPDLIDRNAWVNFPANEHSPQTAEHFCTEIASRMNEIWDTAMERHPSS